MLWALPSFGLGYMTGFIGILTGIILSFLTSKKGKRFQGTIMGFTAGLMIATVCFDLLPEAFLRGGLYVGIFGVSLGVFITVKLDHTINHYMKKVKYLKGVQYLKTGLLMALGISIHNFPEGIAIAIPLKEAGIKRKLILYYAFIFAFPMGLGSAIGYLISGISELFVSLSLGLAGGIILYVTCGEILPESKEMWGGRLSTVGTMLGIILGITIASLIG